MNSKPCTTCKTILVSACLLGFASRYDGGCKTNDSVKEFIAAGEWTVIPVCPEQLGGLPTPRPASQFAAGDGHGVLVGEGRMVNTRCENVNRYFIEGARQALAMAELNGSTFAILKERSPSCGVNRIYRNNSLVSGCGVTTALLSNNRISVYSEEELGCLAERFAMEESVEDEPN